MKNWLSLLLVSFILVLGSCNGNPKELIIGKWYKADDWINTQMVHGMMKCIVCQIITLMALSFSTGILLKVF